jgi:hypothetical protein
MCDVASSMSRWIVLSFPKFSGLPTRGKSARTLGRLCIPPIVRLPQDFNFQDHVKLLNAVIFSKRSNFSCTISFKLNSRFRLSTNDFPSPSTTQNSYFLSSTPVLTPYNLVMMPYALSGPSQVSQGQTVTRLLLAPKLANEERELALLWCSSLSY